MKKKEKNRLNIDKILEKLSRKKKIIIMFIMIAISIIGGTFAWFTYQSNKTALVLSIGDLNDSQVIITPYQIKDTMLPVNSYQSGVYSLITVNNNNDSKLELKLYYKINDLSNELVQYGLKYTIVQSSSKNGTYTEVLTGNFSSYSEGDLEVDLYDVEISSNTTTYYKLYLWLDSSVGNQSLLQNTDLDIELNAYIVRGANEPVLDSGMIPVTISGSGVVTTISEDDDNWYDYSNKKWANIVLVSSSSRSKYLNTTGVTVSSSDILGYYVWIPRFKYKIWTTSVSSVGNEKSIDIIFESKTSKSNGTKVGDYLTHPAFTFGNQSLSGLWVGKFETTGTASQPTVLPNVTSLRNQNVSTQFATSLKFSGGTLSNGNVSFVGSDTYGLTTNMDSHMIKNSEWGAVAYLSHSKYGINEELYTNNSTSFYTGRSGGAVGGSVNTLATQFSDTSDNSSNTYNAYGYYTWLGQKISSTGTIGSISNSLLGTKASTTGNVTGIYDMAGGSMERTMANYSNTAGSSGFSTYPSSKYYDSYSITSNASCTLATCGGHALFETTSWYNDMSNFFSSSKPWMERGGWGQSAATSGMFYITNVEGSSSNAGSFRSVLVPVDSYKVSYVNNLFTTSNQTSSGVTISYDETTSYLTLNGTQTASIGLMSPDIEFKEGDKYKFTLTYVSGSFTASGNYAIGLDASTSSLGQTSTRNYAQMSFPTQGSSSVILTINSAAEEEASKLNHWIWKNSAATITYSNYIVKVEVTKVEEKNIQYKDNYVLPSTPSKTGYTFLGWYTSSTGGTKVTSSTVMNKTSDHSLYAQWQLSSYTLSITKGTGVSKIYYKVNGASSYTSSSSNVSVSVTSGTTYYYYGTASSGYTMSSCTASKPCSGTMGTSTVSKSLTAKITMGNYLINNKSSISNLSTSLTGGLYRYQGTTTNVTNNYICFGTSTKSTCTGTPGTYMYRIIGVDSSGNVKVIKNTSLSDKNTWNTTAKSTLWSASTLYTGLNGSYFLTNTSYVPSGWSSKIASMTWYEYTWSAGNGNLAYISGPNLYLAERNENSNYSVSVGTFTGKVSLMKGSDYYLSLSDSAVCGSAGKCTTSWMWLPNSETGIDTSNSAAEWTMDTYQALSGGYYAYSIAIYSGSGMYTTNYGAYGSANMKYVRPVFYISSSVAKVSGTGTATDPYIIS